MSALASISASERQVLVRIEGGINIGEGELRFQLDRKDGHPLAQAPELMDLLADLEMRGLVSSELRFQLTPAGRARLNQVEPGAAAA